MQITDWLVVILVVAIVGVLLDAVRRRLLDRRNRIVVKLDRNLPPADDPVDELLSSAELPNGGARTLPRHDKPPPTLRNLKSTRKPNLAQPRESVSETVLDSVPVLLDAVEVEEERIEHTNVFVDSGTAAAFAADNLDREQQFAVAPAEDENAAPDDEAQAAADTMSNEVDMHYDEEDTPMLRQEGGHWTRVRETRFLGGDDDEDYDLDDDYEDEEDEDEDEDEDFDEEGLPLPGEFDDEDDEDDLDDDFDEDEDDEDDDFDDDEDEDLDEEDEEEDDLDELEGLPEDEWGSEEEQDLLVDDYENEPILLQETYSRAAGHFSRSDPQPRIEPGFGGDPVNEDELNEDFTEARRDATEELQDAGEPIRPIPVLRRPAPPPTATPPAVAPEPLAAQEAPAPSAEEEPESSVPEREAQPDLFQEEARPKPQARAPLRRKAAEPPPPAPEPAYSGPQEVIVINVMARPGQVLSGPELLPLLQELGLRLGDMSIFHRHAEADGSGTVLFSMANMVKPGTFDLATMDQFTTPGVSLFMQMPNKYGNMACFDHMLHAAGTLRTALEADLKDENRSVFTRQTVEHCRQRIRDFELLLLSKKQ